MVWGAEGFECFGKALDVGLFVLGGVLTVAGIVGAVGEFPWGSVPRVVSVSEIYTRGEEVVLMWDWRLTRNYNLQHSSRNLAVASACRPLPTPSPSPSLPDSESLSSQASRRGRRPGTLLRSEDSGF